jgi:hypothetical protein
LSGSVTPTIDAVRAVRGAERVVHVNIAQLGQRRRGTPRPPGGIGLLRRAVLELDLALLLDVEAQVFEQHDVAGPQLPGGAGGLDGRPDAIVEESAPSRPSSFSSSTADRLERELRDLLAVRPAEMATSARPTRPVRGHT